jgi:hypothetical protein
MHPFATHLIAFLIGAIAAALYGNYHLDRCEVAAFERGRVNGLESAAFAQAKKDSARAKRSAATRRAKS